MSVPPDGAVDTVPVVAATLTNVPFLGVTPPMTKLSNVPAFVGAISTDPVPDGFM
jgi:hypothetical protein